MQLSWFHPKLVVMIHITPLFKPANYVYVNSCMKLEKTHVYCWGYHELHMQKLKKIFCMFARLPYSELEAGEN